MQKLLPDRLKNLWKDVEAKKATTEEFEVQQEKWFQEYRAIWKKAMLLDGQTELGNSLLVELGQHVGCSDLVEVRRRCAEASKGVASEWDEIVNPGDRDSVERFYNQSVAEIYGLLWWHALEDDHSPLAYVAALEFAKDHGCKSYLDFGSGVGSGAVLFARHGFSVACADISTPLLDFCRFRQSIRGINGQFFDLKTTGLPRESYDMITAMDVFEHLFDPVTAITQLWEALKPGGFIYGRFHAEEGDERAGHIVSTFAPTFERMRELKLVEVWRDEWVWGHVVLQKQ